MHAIVEYCLVHMTVNSERGVELLGILARACARLVTVSILAVFSTLLVRVTALQRIFRYKITIACAGAAPR